ncbi:caffeine synthase 1-like isoform X2 [Durio zibethinus]|uniref:Caffeine synthase 1-like isoform X2 n=1 Tax=Durio zibethinus TaxID=66656 RepID=A0A6P6AI09_DURZI|nr:caffeine synthase 1-like isoform X2 [Durio zibethinus]
MEVKEILFMNKGDGENSYVKSSGYMQKVAAATQPMVSGAVQSFFRENCSNPPLEVLNVADLGCSSGPNTFTVMSTVIESTVKSCSELGREIPEIQFYLNDLVGNDFNTLFKGLTVIEEIFKNVPWFAMGAPGSFHGRLFPRNSMHLVHSLYGVHWLSKVPKLTNEGGLPLNKGKIYISKTSPPGVREAYLSQFQEDFLLFLKCRSPEMVPDGRMVLIFHGRKSADPTLRESCYTWEILAETISYLVSQDDVQHCLLSPSNLSKMLLAKVQNQCISAFDSIVVACISRPKGEFESLSLNFLAIRE